MFQSTRILEQALDRIKPGPVNVADPRVILPPKSRAMGDMEAMIFHFKQVMEGIKPPAGEVYLGVENPKGELGYYFVSDGTAKPVRWRIRPPSFLNLAVLPRALRRRAALGRDRHQRQRGHRDGRDRPVTTHSTEPYQPVFTGETLIRLEALATKYPTRQALLLPALWMVQEARGWISPEAIIEVAARLEPHPRVRPRAWSPSTRCTTAHPVGRHFIQVCTTSPCNICGADDVVEALLKHSGCGELGATSPDGRFTVVEAECLGACAFATPLLINDDFIESVTPEGVPALLARYR